MRRATMISMLVIFLHSVRALPQQPVTTGTIEGTVIRSDTGEPVVGAQVTLRNTNMAAPGSIPSSAADEGAVIFTNASPGPSTTGQPVAQILAAQRPTAIQPVTTSSDGKFSFKDLNAGTYSLAATAKGFVRQEYGQRSLNGLGWPILLAVAQTVKDAALRMTPTGTVSGRVFEESGQPATGATIQLLGVVHYAQVKTYQVMGTGAADDRGDYRISGVTPGRYYLFAGTPPGPNTAFNFGGPVITARYSMVYYPSVPTLEQASTVEVKPGTEASFDMRVRRQTQTFRVRGRIVDGTGAGLPANTNVVLAYRTFNGRGSFSTGRNVDLSTGTFELQNVPAGDYTVQVEIPGPNPVRLSGVIDFRTLANVQATRASRPSAQAAIQVVNSDIDGVVLNVTSGISVDGRFVVEGQPISVIPNIQQMSLAFKPGDSGAATDLNPAGLPAAADGTFQVLGLREGEYRVGLLGPLPYTSGFFIKSIEYAGEDILSKPFKFSGSGSGTFEIKLHAGTAQLAGNVIDARSRGVPGVQVFAIPMQRARTTDYRTAFTDRNGHYSLAGITPGDYKIFSWESIDNGAQFDPEFLKQYEQQGKAIGVAGSSSQNVDVKLILVP